LGDNDFVLLHRTLRGAQADATLPRGGLTTIISRLRAPVKTESFYGQNISGPYYLSSAPIVDGSEVVILNDRTLSSAEYDLQATSGVLNFATSVGIIGPTDRVTVSYEVSSGGLGGGTLVGVRAWYPLTTKLRVGVSDLSLMSDAKPASERQVTDYFDSNGSAGPFYLTYRPLVEGSEDVQVNGVLRNRGTYTLNYTTGQLIFLNLLPSNPVSPLEAKIVVRYRIAEAQATSADRNISGFDMRWNAGRTLAFTAQTANSGTGGPRTIPPSRILSEPLYAQVGLPLVGQTFTLLNTPIQDGTVSVRTGSGRFLNIGSDYTLDLESGALRVLATDVPVSATGYPTLYVSYATREQVLPAQGDSALALAASYRAARLTATMGYRAVDPGFTPLEMVGYRNVRRRLEWNSAYTAGRALRLSYSGDDTRLPYNAYAVSTSTSVLMDERNRAFSANYLIADGPALTFQHSSRHSEQVTGSNIGTASSSDGFSAVYSHNAFSANASGSRTTTDSVTPKETGSGVYTFHGQTDNAQMALNYRPNSRFSLGETLAANAVLPQEANATKARGSNTRTDLTYQPLARVTLSALLIESSTGATRDAQGALVSAQTSRNKSLGVDWTIRPNILTFNTSFNSDRAQGRYYSNSVSNSMNTSINWNPTRTTSVSGYYNRQTSSYLDVKSNSIYNMAGIGFERRPPGRTALRVDLSHNWGTNQYPVTGDDGGSSVAASNQLTTLTARLTRPMGVKQSVYLNGEASRNDGFPSRTLRTALGGGWEFHINEHLLFTLDARRTGYTDAGNPSLNYIANQVSGNLNWTFF
jgi:hypothetical protein